MLCGSPFLRKPMVLILTLYNLFASFHGGGLSFDSFNFGSSSSIVFQIQEPLRVVQKPSPIPYTRYTFPI
jgi:hypothetical protein